MRIINKSSSAKYLGLLDRTIGPRQRTPDKDPKGFRAGLQEILRKLGTAYAIQLTEEERKLIGQLLKLDAEGQAFKVETVPVARPTVSAYLLEAERREKIEQEQQIIAVRSREEAIRAETTYASRRDAETAKTASKKLRGEVVAKKLASTGGEEISLSDLMGDNRFIEEHLKDSRIAMDLSNTEGWKAPETASETASEPIPTPVEPMDPATPTSGEDVPAEDTVLVNEPPQKKSKKPKKNKKSAITED